MIRLDVRIEFPPISHFGEAKRIDPAEKKRRNAVRNKRWAKSNRARLAELARKYRARRIAAGLPSDGRARKTARRWHRPQTSNK